MQPISKTNIILTAAALIAIVWVVLYHAKHAPNQQALAPTPDVVVSTDTWPSREVKPETISESNQYYSINVVYPVTKDARISDAFKSFADEQIAQFKNDTAWVTDPSIDSASEGSLSLDISYRNETNTKVDTYVFSIVTYTGGAHGLQVTRTFAYDSNGKLLKVADLFTNGEAGLKTVSTFVQKELLKKGVSDATWIADGAGAKVENYQSFVISDTGVTFIFDPYNVAPYAAGTQNILVPLSAFKTIASPDIFAQ